MIEKAYNLIRYNIPHFIKNVIRFRKELSVFGDWDYEYCLRMLQTSLSILRDGINDRKTHELYELRVSQIDLVLARISYFLSDKHYEKNAKLTENDNWDLIFSELRDDMRTWWD